MKLQFHQTAPGFADGSFHISAPGCLVASLHWADKNGTLENWQSLGFLPLDPGGSGRLQMTGGRAIPAEATHVLARAVTADYASVMEVSTPLAESPVAKESDPEFRFLVLTDLHLSHKPWTVRRALAAGRDYDGVLITGDLTNDGTPEQLEHFLEILTDVLPDTPVFAVTGNHDYPARPLPHIYHGICEYPMLQEALLARAEAMGWAVSRDFSGAYAARRGNTEIFGLNAATHWRRFKFPGGTQLDWLEEGLSRSDARHRILLCHAPLQHHRPYLSQDAPPYLSMDARLQAIVDENTNLIFLSGHTHLSLNLPEGCAQRDRQGNLYYNAGSIRPTTLKPGEPLAPAEWVEGNGTALTLSAREIHLQGFSLKTGKNISRACWRFPL